METLNSLQTEVEAMPTARTLVRRLKIDLESARNDQQAVLQEMMRVVLAFKEDTEKRKAEDAEYRSELETMVTTIYESQSELNPKQLEIERDLKERLEDRESVLAVCEEQLHLSNIEVERLQRQISEM